MLRDWNSSECQLDVSKEVFSCLVLRVGTLKLKMDLMTHQQGLTHRAKMWQATIWLLYEYTVLTEERRSNRSDLTMEKLNIIIV